MIPESMRAGYRNDEWLGKARAFQGDCKERNFKKTDFSKESDKDYVCDEGGSKAGNQRGCEEDRGKKGGREEEVD